MAHAANNLYETYTGEKGLLRKVEGDSYDKIDIGVSIVGGASGAMRKVGTKVVGYMGTNTVKGYVPIHHYSTTAGKVDLAVTGAGITNTIVVDHE